MDSPCKADRRDRSYFAFSSLPVSRHDVSKRCPRDRGLDRIPERDSSRDLRRKSLPPDKDWRDDGDDGFERLGCSRSFGRKTVSVFERAERHFSGKSFSSDRERSERVDTGRRKFSESDRDGIEKLEAARSFSKRSYGVNGLQEMPEGSLTSSKWEEREYNSTASRIARKASGFDKDCRDGMEFSARKGSSASEICALEDVDSHRSPSGKFFGREGSGQNKFSPNRSHAFDGRSSPRIDPGLEDNSLRARLSPKHSSKHKTLSRKESEISREYHQGDHRGEDIRSTSSKSKHHSKKDDLGGASSDEADGWVSKRNSSFKGHGYSYEQEDFSEGLSSHIEGWKERRYDNPIAFFHIAKRVRSERRREERISRCHQQAGIQSATLESSQPDLESNVEAAIIDATHQIDGEVALRSPRSSNDVAGLSEKEELHVNELPSSEVDKGEMEEGELPDEEITNETEQKANEGEEKANDGEGKALINLNDEQGLVGISLIQVVKNVDSPCSVDITVTQAENIIDSSHSVVVPKDEHSLRELAGKITKDEQPSYLDGPSLGAPYEANGKQGSGNLEVKDEPEEFGPGPESTDPQLRFASHMTSANATEAAESSKEGSALMLLDERTAASEIHAKEWTSGGGDNPVLSLFTHPSGEHISSQIEESKERSGNVLEARSRGGSSGEDSLVDKGEKPDYGRELKRMRCESFGLSLALPGLNVAHGGEDPLPTPRPVEQERSFQSPMETQTHTQYFSISQTRTNSDGFTTSLSLTQSQSFIHNPSCSLNWTSMENQELSCAGSRQFLQGNEQASNRSWQAPSGNEQLSQGVHATMSLSQEKLKHEGGIPLSQQWLVPNQQAFLSATTSNRSSGTNYFPTRDHQQVGGKFDVTPKVLESSYKGIEGSGKQDTSYRDLCRKLCQQGPWLASKASQETRSDPRSQQERERLVELPASTTRRFSCLGNTGFDGGNVQANEKLGLHEIVSEPVATMAQKLQELPDSFLDGLKGLAKEVFENFEKREEFVSLQNKIARRTDLTLETLLYAHRTQLEILVALKMGMRAFLQEGIKPLTNTALFEIFLQTKCRNIACQLPLPVYGCQCRICSQKKGFCHECMCVVCFKFDTDNNTCHWVGCDVCSHWCHTDCGLRLSYIAPVPSVQRVKGCTEMQYRCAACDHHSELFGFVKEVFQNFAESWSAEALAKELDCVRRIFHGSEDMRGKQLCWKAEQMLAKLESKVPAVEVCRSILRYLNDGNAELDGASKQPSPFKQKGPIETCQDSAPKTSSVVNKIVDLEKAHTVLKSSDEELAEKRSEAAELQYDRTRKRAEVEDIESVVRIKQAESKMFQMRADEARQEASGLHRIISVKREKIEEDYACKYALLRLAEAEERKTKRIDELKALETARHDYQKMKVRMETEIKDLLIKMETTKQQYT